MVYIDDLIAEDIELYLKKHEEKEMLRFITCGSVDDGKSFTARVTVAFPAIVLKSGKNLLTETNLLAVPSCPCKSKSYDCRLDVIVVTLPSSFLWSVPTSC